jgi:soluble lytic murein transglycosylase-like protein
VSIKTVNHYDRLGVSRDAPAEVIRAAYKAQAQKNHPDRNLDNPDATNIMQEINRAHDVLSDPDKRAEYDAWLARQEQPPLQQPPQPQQQAPRQPGYRHNPAATPPEKRKGFLLVQAVAALAAVFLFYIFYSQGHVAPPPLPATAPRQKTLAPPTPEALAQCIFSAAGTYNVPPPLLLAIVSAEGGSVGREMRVPGRAPELGLMRISASWGPRLAQAWKVDEAAARRMLKDDPCANIGVGAWILRAAIDKGDGLPAQVALYRTAAHGLPAADTDEKYVSRVISLADVYKSVRSAEDLIGSSVPAALKKR